MRRRGRATVSGPRVMLAGVGVLVLGSLMHRMPGETPGRGFWPWLVLAGLALLVVPPVLWVRARGGSAGTVSRWSRRGRRNQGVASRWSLLRTSSAWAMRRQAVTLRPSLRTVSWWRRWLVLPVTGWATPLARVGLLRVWSACEDVTLRVGGPRTGKTGELAGRILDAPGAVLATSTRTDLVALTGPVRSGRGPVRVFNPSGLGRLESTVTFDPLAGCQIPRTATERAADLLSGVAAPGRSGEMEFWTSQARRILAALLHAAALSGASMRDLLGWVAAPAEHAQAVQRAARRSPEVAFSAIVEEFAAMNERTRTSICATIMPALGWLTDATAAKAATGGGFDVAELLESRGTVFLLGAEDGQTAPLVTALTGHIAREARRIAAEAPAGRLDPPLTLALDEAALICPIPLDSWTADMGGRGVPIHIAAQSRAQLRQRWGDTGAAAILNNAATVLIFGGTRDPEDLDAWSKLTGERDEPTESFDWEGRRSQSTRRVPVLSPAQIAQLPARRVVIIRRGLAPAVGRVQMAWKRPDVRHAVALRRRAERAEVWAQRAAAWAETRRQVTEEIADAVAERWPRFAPFARDLRASHDWSRAYQTHYPGAAEADHNGQQERPVGVGRGRSM